MHRLCLLLGLSACDPTVEPAEPAELDHGVSGFSLAYTHTLAVADAPTIATTVVRSHGSQLASTIAPPMAVMVDVAAGRHHACALSITGSVHCWGDHTFGALGAHRVCEPPMVEGGVPNCLLGPAIMPTLPPSRAIVAGDDVTCAITDDDHVICWGRPDALGGSRLPALDPPVAVAIDGGELLAADHVRIFDRTVCAVALDGTAWCWGDGFGTRPIKQPYRGVRDIALGRHHQCVSDERGLHCRGDNWNGQTGDAAAARSCQLGASSCTADDVSLGFAATRVVVGERHTCALDGDRVICFGSNEVGQIGRSDAFLVGAPAVVLDSVVDVQSGYAHVCALRRDRSLWCWGDTDVTDPDLADEVTP